MEYLCAWYEPRLTLGTMTPPAETPADDPRERESLCPTELPRTFFVGAILLQLCGLRTAQTLRC